jgi:hypothetical protein
VVWLVGSGFLLCFVCVLGWVGCVLGVSCFGCAQHQNIYQEKQITKRKQKQHKQKKKNHVLII